jgi:hypothetical protein
VVEEVKSWRPVCCCEQSERECLVYDGFVRVRLSLLALCTAANGTCLMTCIIHYIIIGLVFRIIPRYIYAYIPITSSPPA